MKKKSLVLLVVAFFFLATSISVLVQPSRAVDQANVDQFVEAAGRFIDGVIQAISRLVQIVVDFFKGLFSGVM